MKIKFDARRLTKDQINQRLIDRGITIVGEYVNAHSKTKFMCEHRHEWLALTCNVLAGKGCPICAKRAKLSANDIHDRLEQNGRGITMIGEFLGSRARTSFLCSEGHVWDSLVNNVIRGSGCPICANNVILTDDQVRERLPKDITMIGNYINAKSKIKFRHDCGNEWESTPDNIMRGKSCPKCSIYGFNPNKEASLYLLDFGTYIKYGITNDLERRLSEHRRNNGNHTVILTEFFENGNAAKEIESRIRTKFKSESKVDKEQCPDGWTETLPTHLSESVIELIREII